MRGVKPISCQMYTMTALLVIVYLGTVFPVILALDSVAYSMQEETRSGTEIGNIKTDAALIDQFTDENYQRLIFSILTPADGDVMIADYFEVEESTGVLKVLRPLDRDDLDICAFMEHCLLTFDVAVGPEDIFHVISVRIEVEDVNDNSPVFGLSQLSLNISEVAARGTSYQLPVVADQDGDSYGVRQMMIRPASDQFAVRWMRGSDGKVQPRLELLKPVDREQVTSFDLSITAYDGGARPRSALLIVHVDILDVNDNVPLFQDSQYDVSVPEDGARGTSIVRVKATDPDHAHNGDVIYKMAASTRERYGDLFEIMTDTGIITLGGGLDRETQDVYYLTVLAVDNGEDARTASATVTVHVDDKNDNSPVIRINTLTDSGLAHVAEDSDVGTFVALLSVKDQDQGRNADVTCTLNTEDFRLEALQANKFKIVTGVLIDREQRRSYGIEVFCHDHGIPQKSSAVMVTVQVDDVNDHSPLFNSDDVTMHVTENSQPETVIGQVQATDEDDDDNGRVTYSTTDTFNTHVSIDRDTGVISTISSLDRESLHTFIIYVIARDHGNPARSATATVTVLVDDVNDMAPVFTQMLYTFVITENENTRRELSRLVATDRDEAPYSEIRYSLRGPNAYFLDIDPHNGTLFAVKPLDRELMPYIEVQAVATDVHNPELIGLANVTVYVSDVNDHAPRIIFPSPSNSTIDISSQLGPDDTVGWIQAVDGDSGQNAVLEYFLTFPRSGGDDLLTIDSETGLITVIGDLSDVDFDVIRCVVVVKDGGIPSLVTSTNFTIIINSTLGIQTTITDDDEDTLNTIIIIVVIAATIVLVAILVGAIVFVFRRTRRRRHENKKPRYTVENIGTTEAQRGHEDMAKCQYNCAVKPVVKIYDPKHKACKEVDLDSLGSGEGSTTDSGRGASEEGEHDKSIYCNSLSSRHNDSSEANISSRGFTGADDSITTGHLDLSASFDHHAPVPQQWPKTKDVTFEENAIISEFADPAQCRYSTPHDDDFTPPDPEQFRNNPIPDVQQFRYGSPYDSCQMISYNSSDNTSYPSVSGFSFPSSYNSSSSPAYPSAIPYPNTDAAPYPITDAAPYPITDAAPYPITDAVPYPITDAAPYPITDAVPYPITDAAPYPITDAQTYPSADPWCPDPVTDYPETVPPIAPRRTVRDVKTKDTTKRLDSLAATHADVHMLPSDPDGNSPYDFTDSNSLLKYKIHGIYDSTSEINSAASTTSGTYIIQTDDLECDCSHGN